MRQRGRQAGNTGDYLPACNRSMPRWLLPATAISMCSTLMASPTAKSRFGEGRLTFEAPVLIGYSGDGVPGWDDSCASYVALDTNAYVGMVQSGGANKPGHKIPMIHPAPLVFSGDGGLTWADRVNGLNTARWAQCGNSSYCVPTHGAFVLAPARTPSTLHTWGALRPRYDSRDKGAVSFFAPTSTEFSVEHRRRGAAPRLIARDGPPVHITGLPIGMTGNAQNDCLEPKRRGGMSTRNDSLAYIFGAVRAGEGFVASAVVCEPGARGNSIAVFGSDDGYNWRFLSVAVSAHVWQARDLVKSYGAMYNRSGVSEHDLSMLADNRTLVLTFRPGGDSGCLANPNPGGRYWYYYQTWSTSGGRSWSSAVPVRGAGCARPRSLALQAGPLLLSGGRLCVEGTKDVSLWVNWQGTVSANAVYEKFSVSFWHNKLWRGQERFRFNEAVNDTHHQGFMTQAYTSLLPAGNDSVVLVYNMYPNASYVRSGGSNGGAGFAMRITVHP